MQLAMLMLYSTYSNEEWEFTRSDLLHLGHAVIQDHISPHLKTGIVIDVDLAHPRLHLLDTD
jgi:nuclear transport factor 2 (NTF2) superfamily protein